MSPQASPNGVHRPWGRAVAALTAALVTLIGACCDLDPDVILLRAACSALLLGGLAAVAGRMVEQSRR